MSKHFIADFINKKGFADRDLLLERLKAEEDLPDQQTIEREYWCRRLTQIISRQKDRNGIRDVFALRKSDGSVEYISMLTGPRIKKEAILRIHSLQFERKKKTLDKITASLQISMFNPDGSLINFNSKNEI